MNASSVTRHIQDIDLEYLFKRYLQWMVALTSRRGVNRGWEEDVAVNVFIDVTGRMANNELSFENRGEFQRYISQAVRNQSLDQQKRSRRESSLPVLEDDSSDALSDLFFNNQTEEPSSLTELVEVVERALKAFDDFGDPKQFRSITKGLLLGFSPEDVRSRLQISKATLQRRIRLIRDELHRSFPKAIVRPGPACGSQNRRDEVSKAETTNQDCNATTAEAMEIRHLLHHLILGSPDL